VIAYNPGVLAIRARRVCVVAIAVAAAAPESAWALEGYSGTRQLGMGGASRAWAIGGAGPLLNPSGMSLMKSYTVEAGYGYGRRFTENVLHASVVDGTSMYNIAGGLYYNYHHISPAGMTGQGHEGGLALALPIGQYVAFGATVKYLRFTGADVFLGNRGGVTFDLGATIRPIQIVSLGVVGTNLYDLGNGYAPQGVGYGVALLPLPNLVIAADGRTRFTADNITGRKGTSFMLGAEYALVQRVAFRAGGGYDAANGNGYVTAGLSGISDIGAFDAGIRQDVSLGNDVPGMANYRQTVLGVSLRLFVPASQTQQPMPMQP
jgi:hypothetical protein